MSIYLLHHAVRDQRVGAGRADHNHDLGGGSIEDLGLVQGDRWGWPRHRWGWPVRVVDQGGSAQDLDLGEGSGGPGHGTPPGVQLCGGPAQGAPWGEGSGRSGLGAPWTRAAQLATSAWAVAPSRTWAPTWLEPRICLDVAS